MTLGPDEQDDAGCCSLRIFHLNDVYLLDNFPRIKTLIRTNRTKNSITTLAGDFVAPSLLSSLDKGYGIVDIMNHTPVDLVCFGNHEADLKMDKLRKRMDESDFAWINSNMPGFEYDHERRGEKMPPFKILEVKGKDGRHARKVGLIGLLTEDKTLYQQGAFGGATIEPVVEAAIRYKKLLEEEHGCDLVVPLTHQDMQRDVDLANLGLGFPLILGGHDHTVFVGEYGPDKCQILKGGADANNAIIVDITWPDSRCSAPLIKWELVEAKRWEPDRELAELCKKHLSILWDLEHTVLQDLEHGKFEEDLSSEGMRSRQTTMGTYVTTSVRKASPGCEVCLLNAGGIRGNKRYNKEAFTYADLKTEIPFANPVAVIELPGRVIVEAIQYSRQWSGDAEKDFGGFLQVDNRCKVRVAADDDQRHILEEIDGEAVDPSRKYVTAVDYNMLKGMDGILPITEFARNNVDDIPPEDAAIPIKVLLTGYWYKKIWRSLGRLHEIDTDGDGVISKDEVKAALQKKFGSNHVTYENVKAVYDAMDLDGDGKVTVPEVILLEIDADRDGIVSKAEMKAAMQRKFGSQVTEVTDENVQGVLDAMDLDGDGTVTVSEAIDGIRKISK